MPTFFPCVLEINRRLEMGQRLLKSLGSEPVYFNIGVTAAVLKSEGTIPVRSG